MKPFRIQICLCWGRYFKTVHRDKFSCYYDNSFTVFWGDWWVFWWFVLALFVLICFWFLLGFLVTQVRNKRGYPSCSGNFWKKEHHNSMTIIERLVGEMFQASFFQLYSNITVKPSAIIKSSFQSGKKVIEQKLSW